MMDKLYHQTADLLLAIEAEMRRIGLWESTPPPPAALESLAPFCHDTLAFHQWIQWVFIPKMKQVLESGHGFPASSDIFPLAEYSFDRLEPQTDALLALIRKFDSLVNEG